MPQTVPNRPTYGLVEPTVASVARLAFQPVDLPQLRDAHRAPHALEQFGGRHRLAAQARELAEAGLEDALHAERRLVARADRAIQLAEVAAGPERALEPVGFGLGLRHQPPLAEDDGPGRERREQQHRDDDLHDRAGVQDQREYRVRVVLVQFDSFRIATSGPSAAAAA